MPERTSPPDLLAPSGDGRPELATERLVLRRWRTADLEPFAALNADPEVMAHFVRPLGRPESDALARRFDAGFDEHGLGMWAVARRADGRFVGTVGLLRVDERYPFGPTVETGWRLRRDAWGEGLATEAARAALGWGFGATGTPEIVAFTSVGNRRSRAVMERLGMVRDPAEDFAHPNVPADHPLCAHVLYRIDAARLARTS